MRYWWVNQNQTYRHEVEGGYLWSPKRSASGARNPFYESMREVSPGDLIFSFMDTRIQAIGIAQSYCWESPKPLEFGTAGQNWEDIGWKVKVAFTALATKIRPKDHIDILRPLLPERYSPLQPNGNGLQSVYLTEIPADLAEVLMGLIGQEVEPLALAAKSTKPIIADDIDLWERQDREGGGYGQDPAGDRSYRHHSCPERPGALQGSGEPNRTEVPDNGRSEPSPSGRQPLQAVARFLQRGAVERRERAAPDAEYRPPL